MDLSDVFNNNNTKVGASVEPENILLEENPNIFPIFRGDRFFLQVLPAFPM